MLPRYLETVCGSVAETMRARGVDPASPVQQLFTYPYTAWMGSACEKGSAKPNRRRRGSAGQIEQSMAMDAYLLSFSAHSLGAQHTNNKFGTYVLMCDTNVCTLNLVS